MWLCKSELVNRTQALDKEISGSPTGIKPMNSQTPDRHSTTELWELVESKVIYNNWVLTCMWQASRILLGSALSKSSWVWTLSKTLQISHAVLLRCVNQCAACFFCWFASFLRYYICKKPYFSKGIFWRPFVEQKTKETFCFPKRWSHQSVTFAASCLSQYKFHYSYMYN